MEINFKTKLVLYLALISSFFSCQQREVAPKKPSQLSRNEDTLRGYHKNKGSNKTNYYFSPYKVYTEKPSYSVYDTLHVKVYRDTQLLLDEKLFTGSIEDVFMRDLDQDQKPELYIIWYGTGSAGYGSVEVFEIEGKNIDQSALGWIQNVYFTESQVIREIYFEGDDGCCEQLGTKFIYYELINNQFVEVKESTYLYSNDK